IGDATPMGVVAAVFVRLGHDGCCFGPKPIAAHHREPIDRALAVVAACYGAAVAIHRAVGDGMTVAGLRRERDRDRLVIEKIAGKEFTTLAHIERMRELCRDEARAQGSSLRPPVETRAERSLTKQHGSSETTDAMSAQAALQMKLRPRKES